MTTITVTFLCAFTQFIKDEPQKRATPAKKSTLIRKHEASMSKSTTKENPLTLPSRPAIFEEDVTTLVSCKKPVKNLHIEYNILPSYTHKVDVIFYGTIARVFSTGEIKAMKSINKENNCWIAFSIQHKFILNSLDLVHLKSHVINFVLSTDKNDLGPSAKKEELKTFYYFEEAIEQKQDFAEVFETEPISNTAKTLMEKEIYFTRNYMKSILDTILHFPGKNEILNVLKVYPDKEHQQKIMYIMKKMIEKKYYNCINSKDVGIDVQEVLKERPKTGSTAKSMIKQKSKEIRKEDKKTLKKEIFHISIPAEIFFTDQMVTYDFLQSNFDLYRAFVTIKVENLISNQQKIELNPIIVKLDKIVNIPSQILEENRFKFIYLSYDLCNENYISPAINIARNITFKEHHIYFLDKNALISLCKLIQTGYFIVKIHGLKSNIKSDLPELFGQNKNDQYISHFIKNKDDIAKYTEPKSTAQMKSVLLAVTCFKVDELLKPLWRFSKCEYAIHPSRCVVPLDRNIDHFDKITINNINEHVKKSKSNPLTEEKLLTNGTCLEVTIELLNPVNSIWKEMITDTSTFKRLLLIIYKNEFAETILTNIIRHNSYWYDKEDTLPPNYLLKNEPVVSDSHKENIITGFSIDSRNIYIVLVEGKKKWIDQLFLEQAIKADMSDVKIFYNSDKVYDNRFYTNFYNYGGVYNIILQYPLEMLLNCGQIFASGHIPEPCKRAFAKLDSILKCTIVKEITDNYLPTMKELISLDIEWGVPVHWTVES